MEFVNPEGLRQDGRRPHEACANQHQAFPSLDVDEPAAVRENSILGLRLSLACLIFLINLLLTAVGQMVLRPSLQALRVVTLISNFFDESCQQLTGGPTHQSVSYLKSVCKSYEGSKILVVVTQNPHLDILIMNMYLLCKISECCTIYFMYLFQFGLG